MGARPTWAWAVDQLGIEGISRPPSLPIMLYYMPWRGDGAEAEGGQV